MAFICPTSVQSKSLWMGEIDSWMDENFISKSVKIIRDKLGKSSSYGFVEFDSPEVAKEVLNFLGGKLIPETKKTFKLNPATYSASKVASMGNFPSKLNQHKLIIIENEYTIYVGDLDGQVTEEKLKNFFLPSYKIVIDNITKQSKGYGFVKFSDYQESVKAIEEMNGKMLYGRPIKTK